MAFSVLPLQYLCRQHWSTPSIYVRTCHHTAAGWNAPVVVISISEDSAVLPPHCGLHSCSCNDENEMRLDFFIKTLFYDECHTKNVLIISSSCASGRGMVVVVVVLVVVAPLMVLGQKGKQTFWMAASCAEFKDSTAVRVEEESGSTNKRSRFYGMSQLLVEYLHLGPPNGWMGMMWWMIVPIVRRRCGSGRVVWIS